MFYRSSNTEEVNVVTERKVDIMRHKEITLLNELCNGSNKEFNTIVKKTLILIGLLKKICILHILKIFCHTWVNSVNSY